MPKSGRGRLHYSSPMKKSLSPLLSMLLRDKSLCKSAEEEEEWLGMNEQNSPFYLPLSRKREGIVSRGTLRRLPPSQVPGRVETKTRTISDESPPLLLTYSTFFMPETLSSRPIVVLHLAFAGTSFEATGRTVERMHRTGRICCYVYRLARERRTWVGYNPHTTSANFLSTPSNSVRKTCRVVEL